MVTDKTVPRPAEGRLTRTRRAKETRLPTKALLLAHYARTLNCLLLGSGETFPSHSGDALQVVFLLTGLALSLRGCCDITAMLRCVTRDSRPAVSHTCVIKGKSAVNNSSCCLNAYKACRILFNRHAVRLEILTANPSSA